MGVLSSLFSRGKGGNAENTFERLLQSGSEAEILEAVATLRHSSERERTLDLLASAAERFPENAQLRAEAREVELEIAHAAVRESLKKLASDDSPLLRAEISDLYRRTGESDKAIVYGRQSIQLDPKFAPGYRAIGRVYFDQFRCTQSSIDGMNALRYLSKAHRLQPSNSLCILQLAEIFAILRAPRAAMRFLDPVKRAFGDDPLVVDLSRRIDALPDEQTSHIQELFLRHEQLLSGGTGERGRLIAEIPAEASAEMIERAQQIAGLRGFALVNHAREFPCSWLPDAESAEQLSESLGLLAETLRQNSERMDLGAFQQLTVSVGDHRAVIGVPVDGLTAFLFGSDEVRTSELEELMGRVSKTLRSTELTSA